MDMVGSQAVCNYQSDLTTRLILTSESAQKVNFMNGKFGGGAGTRDEGQIQHEKRCQKPEDKAKLR